MIDGGQINHQPVPTRAFVRIDHDAPGRFAIVNDGITISATTENRSDCGTYDPDALVLHYAIGDAGAWETMPMAGGSATIPGLAKGDVVRYWFEIEADGSTFVHASESAPHVALVDPEDQDLFREDFEGGFGTWTHGVDGSDLVDDWEVGAPGGRRLDPYAAHSGTNVAGTDLGQGEAAGSTNGAAKPGRNTFLESEVVTTEGMENIRLELWQHYVVDGTLRILVDGEVVHEQTGTADDWSAGWRFMTFALPETTNDRADGFTIRFEVEPGANNGSGGWTIDDIRITGAEIPPPPPPPPPPDEPPPKDPTPPGPDPMQPAPPDQPSPDPNDPNPQDPTAPDPTGRTSLVRGSVAGGCVCVSGADRDFAPLAFLLIGGALLAARRRRRKPIDAH
jgi:MYXO-CTERM domain-containing protein